MADATFKPSSGDDLVLSNDDGSKKIEITDSGDVECTGDFKTTTVKATNLKANDGTAGLSIADSTGRVTFSENNPSINLGSNSTGFTGVKNIDVWHLNANLTGNQNPIEAQRYTRGSTSTGAMNLGTGMTLNQE